MGWLSWPAVLACRLGLSASTNPPTCYPGQTGADRSAVYRAHHLERLRLIAELQDRGLTLSAIRQLLGRRASPGMSVGDWLGLDETLRGPWSEDRPRVVDDNELADALGTRPGIARPTRTVPLSRAPARRFVADSQPGTARSRPPTPRRRRRRRADSSGDGSASPAPRSSGRRPDRAVLWAHRCRIRRAGLNGGTGHLAPCPAPHRSRRSRDHSRPRGRARTAGSPPGRAHVRSPSLSEKQHTTSTLTPEPNHRTAGHPSVEDCTTPPAGSCFLRRRRGRRDDAGQCPIVSRSYAHCFPSRHRRLGLGPPPLVGPLGGALSWQRRGW